MCTGILEPRGDALWAGLCKLVTFGGLMVRLQEGLSELN